MFMAPRQMLEEEIHAISKAKRTKTLEAIKDAKAFRGNEVRLYVLRL